MTKFVIEQDYEADGDELGSPMNVFWTLGHGHDAREFIEAVIDYTLDSHDRVPRIEGDDEPVELWQWTRDRGDWVEYVRAPERPTGVPRDQVQPITLLDLDRSSRGAPKCAILHCREPWARGANIHAAVEPEPAERMTVQVYLCREHSRRFPEPSYRVHMIPVGAEILLPAPKPAEVLS